MRPPITIVAAVLTGLMFNTCIGAELLDGRPQLKISGQRADISFAVKEYTHVTVEVVNAKNQIVRHLGSGVLGPDAPPPFQKDTKSQIISWDLKDNEGNSVDPKANLRVLVRAGLKPAFGRMLGQTGQALHIVQGMVVDAQGNLFVTAKGMPLSYRPFTETKVFDRDGNYLRTIIPFPAHLPESKLQCVSFVDAPGGRRVPFVRNPYLRSRHTLSVQRHQPVVTGDGKLIIPTGGARIAVVGVEGSMGEDFIGPIIAKLEKPYVDRRKTRVHPRIYLAMSPDERYIYASGVVRSYKSPRPGSRVGEGGVVAHDNCVYRIDRKSKDDAVPLIGTKWDTKGIFSNPLGIDVDKDGNLYVCDYGHNRIAVFDSQGKLKKEIPIKEPIQVAVHSTGKIYVYCADRLKAGVSIFRARLYHRIVRLSGKNDFREEARFSLPKMKASTNIRFALDKNATPPAFWIGSGRVSHRSHIGRIRKVVDQGDAFKDLGDVIAEKSPEKGFGQFRKYVVVDPKTEEVWWDNIRFDGHTGKVIGKFKSRVWPQWFSNYGEPRLGPDNSVIFWGDALCRFKRDGKPFPFPSKSSHKLSGKSLGIGYTWGCMPRGMKVDRKGTIHIMYSVKGKKYNGYLARIAWDGKLIDKTLIKMEVTTSGLGIDRRGCFYVLAPIRKYGSPPLPAHWEKLFKTEKFAPYRNRYEIVMGSLLKFPATGGSIVPDANGKEFEGRAYRRKKTPATSNGAVQWSRFGFSGIYSRRSRPACVCEVPGLEVDGHNRIFVPDPLTYSIFVFDENGNEISRFGDYGNMDSQGPGSKIPVPEIPLSYAFRFAVSDKAVYVSDAQSKRVLKVRLDYRETACLNMDGSAGKVLSSSPVKEREKL